MRIGGYLRISRDEDKENYSSILSQRSIIEEYAAANHWEVCKYYEDDNYSGYTFDRPGFQALLEDIEQDRLDIVIAKDLSRIGRHNAHTLLFVEKVRTLKKRLILPKEGAGYDSAAADSDLLGITTWYNEMYVKDISRKTKSSIRSKQKEGKMIVKEYFGYLKSPEDKHSLQVDPEAAYIVQLIFKQYLEGLGYRRIAEYLNDHKYPTPSMLIQDRLLKQGSIYKGKVSQEWNSVHVQRIIKNDIYIGVLRQAKTEKTTIKGKSKKKLPEENFVFYDHHQPIIDSEVFLEAQKRSQERAVFHSKGASYSNNPFAGFIFCEDCGSFMILYNKPGRARSYICGSYHKYGKKRCERHSITEEKLVDCIREYLKAVLACSRNKLEAIRLEPFKNQQAKEWQRLLSKYTKEKQEQSQLYKNLLLQAARALEEESDGMHQKLRRQYEKELEQELLSKLSNTDKKIKELAVQLKENHISSAATGVEILETILAKDRLGIYIVEKLIDKILIDRAGNPTIYLRGSSNPICDHIRADVNLVPDQ